MSTNILIGLGLGLASIASVIYTISLIKSIYQGFKEVDIDHRAAISYVILVSIISFVSGLLVAFTIVKFFY